MTTRKELRARRNVARTSRRAFLALAGTAAVSSPGFAQAAEPRTAIRAGTLLRAGRKPLSNALITLSGGKVVSVSGDEGPAKALPDAKPRAQNPGVTSVVYDFSNKIVTAGFIDLVTGVGLAEVLLEPTSVDDDFGGKDPIRAAFLAADGYNPASHVVPVTRVGGVTSVGIVPRGGLVSGQSAWVDLTGSSPREAIVERSMALHVSFAEQQESDEPRMSRGTRFLRLRELFDDARLFKRLGAAYERNQLRKVSASRLDLVAVGRALDGRIPVVFHVDRASDILTVLEIAAAERIRPIIASGAEAWQVAPDLVRQRVPVIVNPFTDSPFGFSALGARADNARLLYEAGVTLALTTEETHNVRKLRQAAGNAIRAGLSQEAALEAVTQAPAIIMGKEKLYGDVAPGQVANLVVWTGDPFELSTQVEAVFLRGESVSLRTRQTALFERYR